jgi:CheY-like chemotaxis protein
MIANLQTAPVILVVEDEEPIRQLAVEHLAQSGYGVAEAASGEAALTFLEKQQAIDALFTDIRLGGRLTGWDVGEAFRARYSNLPVISTSGYLVTPPRVVPGGVFITKPYRLHELAAACTKLLFACA